MKTAPRFSLCRFPPLRALSLFGGLFLSGALGQEATITAPDPLRELVAADYPEDPLIRLHLALVRVPMREAAEALLAVEDQQDDFWRNQVETWRDKGKLELICETRSEAEDGQTHDAQRSRRFRFIPQGAASHFWHATELAKQEKLPAPEFAKLLQDVLEVEVGSGLKVALKMRKGWRQADLEVDWHLCPTPTSRATKVWQVEHFEMPRFLFRPWHLQTSLHCAANQVFLLGAQMEAPRDGELHTGHVLMAFGRVTLPERSGRELAEDLSERDSENQIQSWTLKIAPDRFLPWISRRRDDAKDGDALNTWLKLTASGEGAELLATSAAALKPHAEARMTSSLRWHDVSGFEPGGTPLVYRPLSCEDREYFLEHRLEASLASLPGTSPMPDKGASSDLRTFSIRVSRPTMPVAWKRFKFAMEQRGDEPEAIELGEADSYRASETVRASFTAEPGRIVLAAACLTPSGQVHATFARLTQRHSPKSAPDLSAEQRSGTTMIRCIETNTSLENLLLGTSIDHDETIRRLLAFVEAGEARLAGFHMVSQRLHEPSEIAHTKPLLFPGGAYLNTATAANGIFFNMREVGMARIGEESRLETAEGAEPGEEVLDWTLESTGPPGWLHWGIWQPALHSKPKAQLPGIEQPVFPIARVTQSCALYFNTPQIIAVVRESRSESYTAGGTPVLRWYVAERHQPERRLPLQRGNLTRFASSADAPHTVQALVVDCSSIDGLPKDPEAAADALMKAVRLGTVPVLDQITLQTSPHKKSTAEVGWDLYYTNGRQQKRDTILTDSSTMPAGTRFSDHVSLDHRLVGFRFEVEGNEWKIVRDATQPQVVTDTFPGTRLEWASAEVKTATINVQRPIFAVQEAQGELPAPGLASGVQLSGGTFLLIRVLK